MVAPRLKKWAEALETWRWVCQEAGMDGFPTKPVDPAELDSMLTELFSDISRAPRTVAA
jgi:CheY-like chemotaxis protein